MFECIMLRGSVMTVKVCRWSRSRRSSTVVARRQEEEARHFWVISAWTVMAVIASIARWQSNPSKAERDKRPVSAKPFGQQQRLQRHITTAHITHLHLPTYGQSSPAVILVAPCLAHPPPLRLRLLLHLYFLTTLLTLPPPLYPRHYRNTSLASSSFCTSPPPAAILHFCGQTYRLQ